MPYSSAYVRNASLGVVKDEAIADDAVVSFEPWRYDSIIEVFTEDAAQAGRVVVNASTGTAAKVSGTSSVAGSGGSKSGNSGTDGNLTVGADSAGMVYVENRLGSQKTVRVREVT